jgi:hypothetical protein
MAKKTSEIENKTRPSLCLQTWLQQNLLYGCFFATGRFEDLRFGKHDVL